MVTCAECETKIHVTCLGLGNNAYPAGVFTCADCILFAAKIPDTANEQATQAAHTLVWLKGKRVRDSSQDTYASGIHRYLRYMTEICHKSVEEALPEGIDQGVDTETIQLFVSWAAGRYKYNTIQSTLSAVIDWHKSKGVSQAGISNKAVKELMQTIKAEQGPDGLPVGKQGMPKPVLRLLLGYLQRLKEKHPEMAELYLRDQVWLLLGFYGLLRRSELISLQMRDVLIRGKGSAEYVELNVRFSKNDRAGKGAVVTIIGTTQDSVPIARTVKEWLKVRNRTNPGPEEPFLTTWDLDSYSLSNTSIKTGQALATRLKQYLTDLKKLYPHIEVNPTAYGMHSLRRGGVMAAWLAGVDYEKIKAHGRWRSDAIKAYLQTTVAIRLQVTGNM